MVMIRTIAGACVAGSLMIAAGTAQCQDFPNHTMRIITSAPGGSSDTQSRIIANALTTNLGQQVIVDNRGNIGGEILAKTPADGYTMMLDGFSLFLGTLIQPVPYDPLAFSPITIVVNVPNIIVVNASLPVKSVKELIALAKSKPGALNYGSGGTGGTAQLGAELFKSMAGVNIVNVNYQGTGQAMTALLANEVQMMVANATIATPHIASGKLRALAVASLQPTPLAPNLPTVAASGVPGYESLTPVAMVAPANTPKNIVNRLNQEIVKALARPEVKERFLAMGVETVGSTPEQCAALIKSEMAKWGKVIKDSGIVAN